MSDLAKFLTILVAIPGFIIALILLIIIWWTEGLITDVLLEAFNINPIIIVLISVAGVVVLILLIIALFKSTF